MTNQSLDKAVCIVSQGTELYCTVQQAPVLPEQASSTRFKLKVLDPKSSRAWSAAFTSADVNEVVANEQDMDLGPQLITAAVSVCMTSDLLQVQWTGPDSTSLSFECWFDTVSQSALPPPHASDTHLLPRAVRIRLPPSGAMPVQKGAAFTTVTADILHSLVHQHAQMQQQLQLAELKSSIVQQHTQAVHKSYDFMISKVETGELGFETGGTLGGLSGIGRVASPQSSKRQCTGYINTAAAVIQQAAGSGGTSMTVLGSPGSILAAGRSQEPGYGTVAASLLPATQHDPFSTLGAQTSGFQGSQGFASSSQCEVAGDAAAAVAPAVSGGVAYSRRQRQQQQSRQEAVKQKLVKEYKQLQDEWQVQLQQVLQATSVEQVQQLSAHAEQQQQSALLPKGSGHRNSSKLSGELAAEKVGVAGYSTQQHVDQPATRAATDEATQAAEPGILGGAEDADMMLDMEGDVPELNAVTARQVVRRSRAHPANPLLTRKHRR